MSWQQYKKPPVYSQFDYDHYTQYCSIIGCYKIAEYYRVRKWILKDNKYASDGKYFRSCYEHLTKFKSIDSDRYLE